MSDGNDGCGMPRREFLRMSAAGVVAASLPMRYLVPSQKGIQSGALTARGERAVYRGKDLRFIGMPVGGICAGQVYLGGDGRLWLWDIFNRIKLGTVQKQITYRGATLDPGGGANYVEAPEQVHPFDQGFAIKVDGHDPRTLDEKGWKDVSFTGEYPMGFVDYRDPSSPVSVSLQAFSPFIPLDADDSGLPVVVMRFTIRNDSSSKQTGEIGGWMENPIGMHTVPEDLGVWRNTASPSRIVYSLEEPKRNPGADRSPVVFEDWSKGSFEGWTVVGDAFGKGPVKREALAEIVGDVGGPTEWVVKSYRLEAGDTNVQGDARKGKLISRDFTIDRRYIEFYIGGGDYPKTACLNLVVDGKVERTATGRREDILRLERFDVRQLEGKRARIEIVDDEAGLWGQIGVGRIDFVDVPTLNLKDNPDYGDMTLALLDPKPTDRGIAPAPSSDMFTASAFIGSTTGSRARAGLVRRFSLEPGAEETAAFVIAWRLPNLILSRLGKVGRHYAARFRSSSEVADYLQAHYARLYGTTRLWHETWYDSTLPHWFLDRTMATASTLATMTCARFANGRFYGWEGIGCCDGTCGHVWQYAQTVGRLFPALERSVREMVDYGTAFHADSGVIEFRGEYGNGYAADAQSGYVLRTYREHQTSPDDRFLRRVYPKAKKALEYLIGQDANDNGILEGRQHNTLDVDLYGPSSWLTSLYLAALRAGEEMAKEVGDQAFASRCRQIFDKGSQQFVDVFWNGSYFIHRLNKAEHLDSMRIGDGCEADQIMGQGWAHQVGLGRIVDGKHTRDALKSLFRNNYLPDVGPFREQVKPGRWYALPGEPGLLMCTFPLGDRNEVLGPSPTWASMYFNECWTGAEYEAAGHMIAEGLVDEGLAVVKAVHDRHHPAKRNPWNEVECSDHYARSMASYGAFVAACGFEYHGPKGHIGFAPKIRPESFRSAFTAAEGWGTFRQQFDRNQMTAGILVRHGTLKIRSVSLAPQNTARKVAALVGSRRLEASLRKAGDRTTVELSTPVLLSAGEELVLRLG